MIVELHILQNFAPSNLNRDDTGSPKDCEFGGHRRARISSQCLKRAVRREFTSADLIDKHHLAERTKRAGDEIARRLADRGRPAAASHAVALALLGSIRPELVSEGKTQYLLFLSDQELDAAAAICLQHWDALSAAATAAAGAAEEHEQQQPRGRNKNHSGLPAEIKNALVAALDGGEAADLALFGRMIADLPDKNVEAACQVAHAISTNRVSMEFDFYTAVDDLKPEDTAGADMLGTVEFNSACFYRYSTIDTDQLLKNLHGNASLARQALAAFLRAAVTGIPTGKQNSMAAHNPPSLVMTVVRDASQWNLANAFLKPVTSRPDSDLVQESIAALDSYWARLAAMYGTEGIRGTWVATTDPDQLKQLAGSRASSVTELTEHTLTAAHFPGV
jgi:CRISPR system Cascade subunit CasC